MSERPTQENNKKKQKMKKKKKKDLRMKKKKKEKKKACFLETLREEAANLWVFSSEVLKKENFGHGCQTHPNPNHVLPGIES